jgi:hypothetical protein
MQAIATALGFEHPITAIIHGGGACYTFHQADGRALSIPTDEMSAETYLRLLFLLKEISLMAQAQYIVNARYNAGKIGIRREWKNPVFPYAPLTGIALGGVVIDRSGTLQP